MADTRVTGLSTLAGTGVALGDELPIVDISDTSMAGTGTDKSITADELSLALARLNPPMSIEDAARGTSGSIASTYDRGSIQENNLASGLASGTLSVSRIFLLKGASLSNISVWSMTTPLATGSNQWFVLGDSSRNKLAITADDTSTAWAANTGKTLAITGGPFVITYTGWHYVGALVVATQVPSLVGPGSALGTANIRAAALIPSGTSSTGLTNPASCPSTFGAITVTSRLFYAEVS